MDSIFDNSICSLEDTVKLLRELKQTYNKMANIDKKNIETINKKLILFSNNTEFIKDNLISIFNDLSNNYSNFTEETCNMIEDHKIVNEMIKDLLPIMVYYSFGKN